MDNRDSKNFLVLQSFIEYCGNHPDQRFWQALRNWSEFHFIYGRKLDTKPNWYDELIDTFYFEGKDD